MSEFIDYYEVLQVHPKADSEVIEKAYKALIFKHHPDRGGDSEHAKLLNEAYEVLREPQGRANYNIEWAMSQRTQTEEVPSPPPVVNTEDAARRSRQLEEFRRLLEEMRSDAGKRWIKAHAVTLLGVSAGDRLIRERREFRSHWWPRYQQIWRNDPAPPEEGRLSQGQLFNIVDVAAVNKKFTTWERFID